MQLRPLRSSLLFLLAAPAMAQNPLFEVRGAPGEHLGFEVQALEDLDGDGLPEVGASFVAPGGQRHVRVFRGSNGSFLKEIQGIPIGDVDGDGQNDRLVPATNKEICVFSGDAGPQLWSTPFGPNVAPPAALLAFDLGDVDGDSRDDLLVNETWWPFTSSSFEIQVSVYSGADGAVLHRRKLTGTMAWPYAAPVGDLDGDQVTEIALADDTTLRVLRADGSEVSSWALPTEVINQFTVTLVTGGASGADVDGDGVPDLGFSPSYADQVDGHTRVYSALDGQPRLDVEGRATRLGGHFDNDGRDDLVLWSDGGLEARSGLTAALLRRVETTTHGFPWTALNGSALGVDQTPTFAAAVGDLDGDGLDELIAGESYPAASAAPLGRVRVFAAHGSDELGTRVAPPAALCPCGPPAAGSGCPNQVGGGATLTARGSTSVSEAHVALTATGLPPLQDAILFVGTGPLTTPRPFGGGVRLLSGPYRRVASHRTPPIGSSYLRFGDTHTWLSGPATAGMPAPFGFNLSWSAGQTYWLQAWYTDTGNGSCPLGSNLTNAVRLTMTP
jgi:hypothetical protein